jgi:heme exporter protein D
MDIRKAALIAAITLSLARARMAYEQLRTTALTSAFGWADGAWLSLNLLFLLPLPVLLVILYRRDAYPAVSKRLRYLALAAAAIQGLFVAIPDIYFWTRRLQGAWTNVHLVEGATVASKTLDWFGMPQSQAFVWSTVSLSAILAYLLVLAVLSRREEGSPPAATRDAQGLRTSAQIATAAGVLAVALNIGMQVYWAFEFAKLQSGEERWHLPPITLGQFVLRNAFNGLPYVCLAIAPLIVYLSIPKTTDSL